MLSILCDYMSLNLCTTNTMLGIEKGGFASITGQIGLQRFQERILRKSEVQNRFVWYFFPATKSSVLLETSLLASMHLVDGAGGLLSYGGGAGGESAVIETSGSSRGERQPQPEYIDVAATAATYK
jgi:hypothetical protein